ncbi:MAG: uroporphyrinogen decarboxylase family protein [Spirochaetota bacterium]
MEIVPQGFRWEPAVYEHKAALISRSPAEVSVSADLLVEALIAERRVYQADLITVGIDVYNLEAEALGAEPSAVDPHACPEIRAPLWSLDSLPRELELPRVPDAGRFALMLEAASRFRDHLESGAATPVRQPRVRVAASGPASIAAKLVGAEDLLMGMLTDESAATRVLEFATEVAASWLDAIRDAGHEAILFDSSASPPLLSPELYRRVIAPLHVRLMSLLASSGQRERPLVMGGDTTELVPALLGAGATSIVCDYSVGSEAFAAALASAARSPRPAAGDVDTLPVVRRNFDPRRLASPPESGELAGFVSGLRELASAPAAVVIGTGILAYGQRPGNVTDFLEELSRECGRRRIRVDLEPDTP